MDNLERQYLCKCINLCNLSTFYEVEGVLKIPDTGEWAHKNMSIGVITKLLGDLSSTFCDDPYTHVFLKSMSSYLFKHDICICRHNPSKEDKASSA